MYGVEWLLFGCDEFHFARSVNKRYRAILPLAKSSKLSVMMTATPITTSILVRICEPPVAEANHYLYARTSGTLGGHWEYLRLLITENLMK